MPLGRLCVEMDACRPSCYDVMHCQSNRPDAKKTRFFLSFPYAGPSVWNNLPQTLRYSDSTSSFKAALKTHLFNKYI